MILETIAGKFASKFLGIGYKQLMNRSEYKDKRRAFITEIKQIEANQMLMAARFSRPGTKLHDDVVGPEFEQLAQAQRSIGISEKVIEEKQKNAHLNIIKEASENVCRNHFPRTIYEANARDIGILTPDEADAVSSFYRMAHKIQDSYNQLGELADQAQNGKVTFSKVTRKMRNIESEIEHLCELREVALEELGADEDEYDEALDLSHEAFGSE